MIDIAGGWGWHQAAVLGDECPGGLQMDRLGKGLQRQRKHRVDVWRPIQRRSQLIQPAQVGDFGGDIVVFAQYALPPPDLVAA